MKTLLLFVSFVLCITISKIDCPAQTLASNYMLEPASGSKKSTSASSSKLAAIVVQSGDNKFSVGLHVESQMEGKLTIKLRSTTTVLHKEVVNSKTYARKYDMYNLPVGEYQIEVENKHEVYIKKMTIKSVNGVRVLSFL
ncbi:hypothetical protein GXP67_21065 [Rhodocytophaga rosea]|uniref:Uncharacterized protein n=1 Tax=Rhodocytophaga rosea TaxID=2704465 RepID=A0A6C0GLK3_9BACT|nr:hypothetical protein [Rhodocytophaga rosea]QHT68961.1 hypothetical protein GXP67_21065 [Rhodocytophaga rosea]